jgi:periplasmic protein TonB
LSERSTLGVALIAISIVTSAQVLSAQPHPKVCDAGTFLNCHEVDGAIPPKLLHSEDAQYPGEARRFHIEGTSVVELIVDENGRPQNVRTVSSISERLPATQREAGLKLDENAVKAVKKFRFKPALLNGLAVPSEITIRQNYHLY